MAKNKKQGYSLVSQHVWFSVTILGLLAVILGSIANFGCRTVSIPQYRQGSTGGILRGGSLDSGPFSYRSNQIVFVNNNGTPTNTSEFAFDTCRYYSLLDNFGHEWDQDSLTTAIRVFASIAVLFGTVGLGGVFLVPCFGTSVFLWNCYGIFFLLTSIFQGLCLTITSSTLCTNNPILQILADSSRTSAIRDSFVNECEVYAGYKCGVVATVFWILAGLLTLMFPAPEKWQDDWCSHPPQETDDDHSIVDPPEERSR
ncbi:hypothetical protein IV203_017989 [Nitzschia inconspicua]|uniref:Uncharacterized protein n=1 Tax=Nitzschia inconspicua TaxID=303405 RepID=A0A9K3Q566_9STRA|nr:hypothetical protein IV203_017989 [Nitzschia inconspicua]